MPSANVVVSQTDANGNPVAFTDTADDQGAYAVIRVGLGAFTVTAQDPATGRTGTAAGTLADPNDPVVVGVTIEAGAAESAVMRGMVYGVGSMQSVGLMDGVAPDRFTGADAPGSYMFLDVPLRPFAVQACDGENCGTSYGEASAAGEEVVLDVTIPPWIYVSGTVMDVDEYPVPFAEVVIQNFDSDGPFGFFQRTLAADENGQFFEGGIPSGNITIWAGFPWSAGLNEFFSNGDDLQDIEVYVWAGNPYSVRLRNSKGFLFDVDGWGQIQSGGPLDGSLQQACYSAFTLSAGGREPYWPDSGFYSKAIENELVIGPQALGALQVTRKVSVPLLGKHVRYLEILANPGAAPVTVPVEVNGHQRAGVVLSASGDGFAIAGTAGSSYPLLGFVYGGSGAPLSGSLQFSGWNSIGFSHHWDVTVPPGSTVILLHFAVQWENRTSQDSIDLRSYVEGLRDLSNPYALSGMSPEERSKVVNFVVPGQ